MKQRFMTRLVAKGLVAGTVSVCLLAPVEEAQACYCSPVVMDPENIAQTASLGATALDQLTQLTGMLQTIQDVKSVMGDLGPLISLASCVGGGLGIKANINLGSLGCIANIFNATGNGNPLTQAVGQSQQFINAVPGLNHLVSVSQGGGILPSVNANANANLGLNGGLSNNLGGTFNATASARFNATVFGNGGTAQTAMQTFSGAMQMHQALYRPSQSAATASGFSVLPNGSPSPALAQWLRNNMVAEYHDATDDAHALALYNIAAFTQASTRYSAALSAAANAAQAGNDLRSQLGGQILLETQQLIAVGEELSAIRGLMAEALRLQSAGAIMNGPAGATSTSSSSTTGSGTTGTNGSANGTTSN